jgi:hypothetical protein
MDDRYQRRVAALRHHMREIRLRAEHVMARAAARMERAELVLERSRRGTSKRKR